MNILLTLIQSLNKREIGMAAIPKTNKIGFNLQKDDKDYTIWLIKEFYFYLD